ncbi:hypothetical protein [Natronospira bacteriovora]|uniref:RiboL-PSP-HEPN domain-containing protein n=1 Tax=Natronospira bacteriovora TaxID=3069753 RepID=A0ABU0W8Z3_9GAMM|nr:hypothetical protein [Natronospira sp. AB-CW4]MDQ2069925.1 hypothetical protein [Natronospira sp. AB-CW4]
MKDSEKKLRAPELVTTSFLRFGFFFARDITLYRDIRQSASMLDMTLHLMNLSINKQPMPKSLESLIEHMSENKGENEKRLESYEEELLYMMYSRLTDNFNCFMKDLLVEVCRTQPKVLFSEAKELRISDAFECSSLDDLREQAIDQKTRALSYNGFKDLVDWCSRRGIDFGLSREQMEKIETIISNRNIIVHRRAELAPLPPPPDESDIMRDRVPISRAIMEEAQLAIFSAVCVIDVAVSTKFKLQTTKTKMQNDD